MRTILFFLFAGFLAGCGPDVEVGDVQNLKGYWEISRVDFPSGEHKEYKVNETVDYLEINGGKGLRRKVMPQFDGTFRFSSQPEAVAVLDSAGRVYFRYTTDYRNWKEEVLSVSQDELSLRNADGIEYHYKKYEPFSVK